MSLVNKSQIIIFLMHYTILCKTIFSASPRSSLHVKNQVWDSSSSDYDFQINSWIEKKQTIADYGLEIDLFSIFEPLIAFVTPYLTTSYEYELPLCPRPMLTTTLLLTLICYQSVPADPNIVDGMFLYVGDYHLTLDKIAGQFYHYHDAIRHKAFIPSILLQQYQSHIRSLEICYYKVRDLGGHAALQAYYEEHAGIN